MENKYDVLVERIDGLKDLMIEKFNNNAKEHEVILSSTNNFKGRIGDLEKRVDKLENWRSYLLGIMALIGVVAALITYIYFTDINTIKNILEKHIEQTK